MPLREGVQEGLGAARLLMVLSSISPLFILWAVRGTSLVPDAWFVPFCGLMVVLPNLFLWWRLRIVRKEQAQCMLDIAVAEDHRDHILVYLFAMLLPFYSEDLGTWRELASTLTALAFIVFLFWTLGLHYMNLVFAVAGYRVFTVYLPQKQGPAVRMKRAALITRRVSISPNEQLIARPLSQTVFLEVVA